MRSTLLLLALILGALLTAPWISSATDSTVYAQAAAPAATAEQTASVPYVTKETFKAEVEDATVPVLIDFTASWCGPCRMITPHIEALSKEFNGKAKVVKVDVDAQPELAKQFGVRSIPNLFIVYPKKSGLANENSVGYKDLPTLRKWLQGAVDKFGTK